MFKGLNPCQDYIVVKKHEKKSPIHLVNSQPTNTIVFEIIKIGPGYWQNGTFIKTIHQVGDMVFVVGNVAELHYNDIVYVMARERDIIGMVDK